jgi:hypothetical protein
VVLVDLDRYARTPFGRARRTSGRHGYVAYFPDAIPRTIDLPTRTVRLLGDAEAELGRLDGTGRLLPDQIAFMRKDEAFWVRLRSRSTCEIGGDYFPRK